jgi:hypothetical protein
MAHYRPKDDSCATVGSVASLGEVGRHGLRHRVGLTQLASREIMLSLDRFFDMAPDLPRPVPVEALGLGTRAYHRLVHNGIATLGDLDKLWGRASRVLQSKRITRRIEEAQSLRIARRDRASGPYERYHARGWSRAVELGIQSCPCGQPENAASTPCLARRAYPAHPACATAAANHESSAEHPQPKASERGGQL